MYSPVIVVTKINFNTVFEEYNQDLVTNKDLMYISITLRGCVIIISHIVRRQTRIFSKVYRNAHIGRLL